MLIRDGARLVRSGADVFAALPAQAPPSCQESLPGLPQKMPQTKLACRKSGDESASRHKPKDIAALHGLILNQLGPSPLAEDQLIRDLPVEPADVSPALTDLEMSGQITRHPGGLISRPH